MGKVAENRTDGPAIVILPVRGPWGELVMSVAPAHHWLTQTRDGLVWAGGLN